jgi:MinD-like ATPase involved in chromosome partitioning or flagellar assembly
LSVEGQRTGVLVVASGAPWESAALRELGARPAIVVLKRCMDVTDLMASAATGQASVAVVSLDAPGLDPAAVDHLHRHGVRPVAVVEPGATSDLAAVLARLGLTGTVDARRLDRLPDAVLAAAGPQDDDEPARTGPLAARGAGRVVAVWGPGGAPGRTTVALGIAGELARRGLDPLVLDADPWGGAVGQHLGVLDEVSGLLASARLHPAGELPGRFTGLQRRVAGLRVVTGLPRPDRWVEVRDGTVDTLLQLGRRQGDVVVDTGFCLEQDSAAEYAGRLGRNAMTLEAIGAADELVVVGSADPVGLSRLARGLVELHEHTEGRPVQVVVNRMRPSLGWSEADVAGMVTGFATVAGLHFLADDRAAVDRALVAGRTLVEVGDSPLTRGLSRLVDTLHPERATPGRRGRLRRRTAGRARRS